MAGILAAAAAVLGQAGADAGEDASRRLSLIIGALLLLSVLIAAATIVFWRMTRPDGRDRGS